MITYRGTKGDESDETRASESPGDSVGVMNSEVAPVATEDGA